MPQHIKCFAGIEKAELFPPLVSKIYGKEKAETSNLCYIKRYI